MYLNSINMYELENDILQSNATDKKLLQPDYVDNPNNTENITTLQGINIPKTHHQKISNTTTNMNLSQVNSQNSLENSMSSPMTGYNDLNVMQPSLHQNLSTTQINKKDLTNSMKTIPITIIVIVVIIFVILIVFIKLNNATATMEEVGEIARKTITKNPIATQINKTLNQPLSSQKINTLYQKYKTA